MALGDSLMVFHVISDRQKRFDLGLLSKIFCEESDNLWCAVHVEEPSSFGSWRRQAKMAKPDNYVLTVDAVHSRMKKLGTTRPIINPGMKEGGSKKDMYYLAEGALKEEMARRRSRGDEPFTEDDATTYLVGEAKKGFPNNPQHQLKSVEEAIGNCDIDGDGECTVGELGLGQQFYSEISVWDDFELGPDSSMYTVRKAYFAWVVSSLHSYNTNLESLQRLVKGLGLGYEAQRALATAEAVNSRAASKAKNGRPDLKVQGDADKALQQATKLILMNSMWSLIALEGEELIDMLGEILSQEKDTLPNTFKRIRERAEHGSSLKEEPLPCIATMLQCPSNDCGLFDCFGALFYLAIFLVGVYMIFIHRSNEGYAFSGGGTESNRPDLSNSSQDINRPSPNRSLGREDDAFMGEHNSPGPAVFGNPVSPYGGAGGSDGTLVPIQQRRFMGDGPLTPNDTVMRHSPRREQSPRRMVHSAERSGMGMPESRTVPPAYQWTPDGLSRC